MVHDISNDHLSVEKVGEIIYSGMCIRLSEKTVERVVKCREYLDKRRGAACLWDYDRIRFFVQCFDRER